MTVFSWTSRAGPLIAFCLPTGILRSEGFAEHPDGQPERDEQDGCGHTERCHDEDDPSGDLARASDSHVVPPQRPWGREPSPTSGDYHAACRASSVEDGDGLDLDQEVRLGE